jgi:hypothetical protein
MYGLSADEVEALLDPPEETQPEAKHPKNECAAVFVDLAPGSLVDF